MSIASVCFGGGLMLGGLGVEYHRSVVSRQSAPLTASCLVGYYIINS